MYCVSFISAVMNTYYRGVLNLSTPKWCHQVVSYYT
jgi:hypothetical protein